MKPFELPKMPELTVSKNGYQIRSDILHMAKDLVQQDYEFKLQGWKIASERDPATGETVTSVEMPQFPGLDQILATAERMYEFVSSNTSRPK